MLWTLAAMGLVLSQVMALCMIPFGLPGTWLQVAVAVAMASTRDGAGKTLAIVVSLAVLGEIVELASGRWGARRFGGSSRAAWGALVGGIVGVFVGAPIPIVGSLVASFVGTFLGAIAGEMWDRTRLAPELRVGMGAVLGRAIGVGVKLGLAVAIAVLSCAAFFIGGPG